jgi:hypothetical protein
MSTSSRDPIPVPPIKSRKRASSRALFGGEYPVDDTKFVEPPKPLLQTSDYTKTRFKEGIIFAETLLRNTKRKTSPIGMHCATIYKEACARLLDMDEDGEIYEEEPDTLDAVRKEWISDLRVYEREMQYMACLSLTHTENAQQLEDEIIQLQRYKFYARYGDIFEQLCKQLKKNAERLQVAGWQALQSKYWSRIQYNLQIEEKAFQMYLKGEKCEEEFPTHLAVKYACQSVGFEMDEMLVIIKRYATRNTLLHSNITPLIKEGKFDTLKSTLNQDLSDVNNLTTEAEGVTGDILKAIIFKMIQTWYTISPGDEGNPEAWIASTALVKCRQDLKGGDLAKQAELEKDTVASVIKALRQREKDIEAKKVIKDVADVKLVDPQKTKRVASCKLEYELGEAKKQKKKWATLGTISAEYKKFSEEYIKEFGALEAPADVVEDPLLNED